MAMLELVMNFFFEDLSISKIFVRPQIVFVTAGVRASEYSTEIETEEANADRVRYCK